MSRPGTRHITPEELQLLADAEMPARCRSAVVAHLNGCWSCRGRLSAHERTLADLALAQEQHWDSLLPRAPTGRARLVSRLRQNARERRNVFPWKRWSRFLPRPVWTAASATALSLLLVVTSIVSPPPLSAAVLLDRAIASRNSERAIRTQELRISVNGKEYRQRLIRNSGQPGWKRVLADADTALGLEHLASAPGLNWDDPLEVSSFQDWRKGLSHSTDHIVQHNSTIFLTTTDFGSNPVRSVRLTVRANDYWPIGKLVWLRDGTRIEVEQLSVGATPPEVKELSARETSAPVSRVARSTAERASALTPEQLAEAEAGVWLALHRLNADFGEELSVSVSELGVVVDGRVSTSLRRTAIASALSGLDNVRVKLKSLEELQPSRAAPEGAISLSAHSEASKAPPALSDWLTSKFPYTDARFRFVDSILVLADSAAQHGYALERLARRFSSSRMELLPAPTREQIFELFRDHVRAMTRSADDMNAALQPLVAPMSQLPVPFNQGEWQADAINAAECARELQEAVLASFSGGASEPLPAHSAVVDLSTRLSRLQQLLERLGTDLNSINP